MALLVDDSAMLVDVYNGQSKATGNPFTIAKILFSGVAVISPVFVEQGSPPLPPVNKPFAVQLTLRPSKSGDLSAVWDKTAKVKIS